MILIVDDKQENIFSLKTLLEIKFITKGYTSGGIDYLVKPFDPDILLLKVHTFCRLFEQTQELSRTHKSLKEEIEERKKIESELEKRVHERTQELLQSNKELE